MLYRNKVDWILKYIKNKKVLDLGCVEHSLTNMQNPNWLHGIIVKHAKSVLGVDILQKEIDTLKHQGYNVVFAYVERMDLKDKFEVIVAGDIIEHASNPGTFMDRVFRHLTPDGMVLITTPNPVTVMRFIELLLTGQVGANSEHTCWFTPQVISELARRNNLRVVNIAYVDDTYQYYRTRSKLWWPLLVANFMICRLRPEASETLCLVLTMASTID